MRVIAGQYRGRTLHVPKGNTTRPTTDRVRESLFSTLVSARGGLEGAFVLDAFAGSGALGIEALSRGASFALLCEQDRMALQALERNTQFLEPNAFKIVHGDVCKRRLSATAPFDVVFLDPPYRFDAERVASLLDKLDAQGILSCDAFAAYEHAACHDAALLHCTSSIEWQVHTVKQFGDTAIDVYRRKP